MEAHALAERGWSISAIARHLNRDRKTIRGYLAGDTQPGVRRSSMPDPLAVVEDYIRLRFADDCHVWASALFDEVVPLGYTLSYPSFVRQIRLRGLRPHCEACRGVKGRDTIEIDHPPGEEIQWDWFERRNAPWGATAYVLLGTLPCSGRIRGVLAECMDQAHLVEAMDKVMRRLGGTARVWRTDRLATVITPGTRDVQPSFAPVAKHYLLTDLLPIKTQVRGHLGYPRFRGAALIDSRPHGRRARRFKRHGCGGGASGRSPCGHRGSVGAIPGRRLGRGGGGGGVGLVC